MELLDGKYILTYDSNVFARSHGHSHSCFKFSQTVVFMLLALPDTDCVRHSTIFLKKSEETFDRKSTYNHKIPESEIINSFFC